MTDSYVLYSVENAVATITLNRPDVHNAFDEAVIAQMTDAFERAGADESVRAVVLRGNGKSFSAGGDLNWMKRVAGYSRAENIDDALALGALLKTINNCPKPTIALVHGSVFGGGVGLTACCDIAVAAPDTKFCLSEVRIGLIPSIIAPYVIAAMGQRQARRYFMSAERFDAKTAHDIGFVHEIGASADHIIKALMDGAPGAQARGKALILQIAGKPVDDEMIRLTAENIADARASAEGQEGLNAFLDKSEPKWRVKS